MDVFGAVVTAGGLILQFLDACSSYSDEAKSLKTRFDWDIRVLKALNDYFMQKQASETNQKLAPEDVALLEQTAIYLDGLVSKVEKTLRKIERKGWLYDNVRRAVWIARRSDLKDMEKEMFEWTQRFDVRLLGLPSELRRLIPATSGGEVPKPPAVVTSNNRLKDFLALDPNTKQQRSSKMLLENSDDLASLITRMGDVSLQPFQYGDESIIFSCRKVPRARAPGTAEFQRMVSEMGELAAALNCLDPAADIKLLKVEYYFYHADSHQFLFAQRSPYNASSMMTLAQMISGDPFPKVESPLDERLKLAYKITEAVFFLHTAGFLHKNITSSSVIALRRSSPTHADAMPIVGDAYLMGFDLIRGNDAVTTKEGAVEERDKPRSVWDFDVFQHPERLQGQSSPRYVKTHDLYSLGVLLLEIGLWEPLHEIARYLTTNHSTGWAEELSEVALQLGSRTGERYQSLVSWCLNLTGDHIVQDADFAREIMDPLAEIVIALSDGKVLNA